MSNSPEPVSVIILDKKYQFACEPEQRNDLVEAARHVEAARDAAAGNGNPEGIVAVLLADLAAELGGEA